MQNQLPNNITFADMRTADRIQRQRQSNRIQNMSPERIYNQNNRFKIVPQVWDYEHPCRHCGCIHLKSLSAVQREICCRDGLFISHADYPKLYEIPLYLKYLMLERTEHFSSRSSYYNNIFSIAVTGYDNGRDGVGCEQMNVTSALKMNGRSYHFFPNSSKQKFGGIANFTYDGSYQVEQHRQNLNSSNGQREDRVYQPFVIGKIY